LAGSPLPGGSRTLRIATKGFRSQSHPPFLDLSWRKGSFILNPPSLSLDHLVRAAQKRQRNCDAKRLGRFKVEDKVHFGGPRNRQVGGLLTLKNPADIDAHQTVLVHKAASVAHQAPRDGKLPKLIDRRHCIAECQGGDLLHAASEQSLATDHEPACTQLD